MLELQALRLMHGHQLHLVRARGEIHAQVNVEALEIAQAGQERAEGEFALCLAEGRGQRHEGAEGELLLLGNRCIGQRNLCLKTGDMQDASDELGQGLADMTAQQPDLAADLGKSHDRLR